MWKPWRLPGAIRIRYLRREAKFGGRGFANDAPELNSDNGSLFRGGSSHVGEKRNPVFAGAPEEAGSDLGQKTEGQFKPDAHSAVKSCSGIGSLVISKCAHIFESRGDTFDGNCSLQDVLKPGLWLSSETLRRFWRVSELKPDDFLDILIGFGSSPGQVRKARFLWNLYRWASQQSKEFQHLPRSNETMVAILVDAHMLSLAESLLLSLHHHMALAVSSELFSRIIQAYSEASNLEKSVALYDYAREGLYRHAKYVFEDMVERKVTPNVSTYKIILAGYCWYRQFDDIERVLRDMKTNGVNDLPSGNCALSKTLSFLGLDHLGVKIKRDNATGFPKAEFFDSVGNGLYLDTDSKKFEISLAQILDTAVQPDVNSELVSASQQGNVASALLVKDEAFQWGYAISPASCAELFKALCVSPAYIIDAIDLMEEMPAIFDNFGAQNLNLFIQTLSRNGMSAHARLIFKKMVREGLSISQDTYTYLMIGFCRERNIAGFWECWNLATNYRWSPDSKDMMALTSCLCKWGVIEEALKLMNPLFDCYPDLFFSAYYTLLEELCRTGFTSVGCAMLEALKEKGMVVDRSMLFCVMEGFLKEQKTAESIGMYDMWLYKCKELDAFTFSAILPSLPLLDTDRAKNLVESILNMEFTEFSYCSCILKELVQTGNMKRVMPVLQESTPGKFSGTLLNSLIQAYGCLKNWRMLDAVLCMMLKMHADLSISSYRFLVCRMCEQSRFSSASSLRTLFQHSDKSRKLISCNILIFYLFQRRNTSQVHDLLKDMECNGISPDRTTYDFLVYGFHKSGDANSSVCMLDACIAQGIQPSNRGLRIVLSHYCRLGNLDKSLALFHLIESSGWKHGSIIRTILTSCLLSSGRHLEAKLCLNNLSKSEFIGSYTNFDDLIKKFCILGDLKTSLNLLDTMLKKGKLPSEVSYNSVIYRLCILKEFDQALDFLVEMHFTNLTPSETSCDALVHGLCATGRTCDARKILQMLITLGSAPSYGMYRVVLDSYHRSNNLQKATALLHDMQQAGHVPNFEMHWSIISNFSSTNEKAEGHGEPILPNLFLNPP
ncbi:hypothetical protein PVAP13_9KG605900 [Panicum virgatum]|uniref:Pentatricopeptide repeat-containing protein n=1 Tax=Panicum virgatum TaxID=38727 RepID=A0A8T0P0G3_PANVG|nr:hypothetical protein PVAP13_9KG605900 [Panicum virgatum]